MKTERFLEKLEMLTPRREELDEPHVIRLQDELVEVGVRELDDVIFGALAATARRRRRRRSPLQLLLDLLLGLS